VLCSTSTIGLLAWIIELPASMTKWPGSMVDHRVSSKGRTSQSSYSAVIMDDGNYSQPAIELS